MVAVTNFTDRAITPAPSTLTAPLQAPHHGADLAEASRRYGIPLSNWLDLSTGINPRAYPVGMIESASFQHLPFDDNALREAARVYCDEKNRKALQAPLAAAGSQVFIQWLPLVKQQLARRACRVAVPLIGYSEHAFRWQWAGHELVTYDPRTPAAVDQLLQRDDIDVLIVINAHNPLGMILAPEQLLAWHAQLARRDGWLIVDEAFIDPTPTYSVVPQTDRAGLIVLRSLGKFFGLAGVRCGFAFCDEILRNHLRVAIGPWSVSGPTLAVASAALRDIAWQQQMRQQLPVMSAANAEILRETFNLKVSPRAVLAHALFNSVVLSEKNARYSEEALAHQGIRVRRIELDSETGLLRFGLTDPDCTLTWNRFVTALQSLKF
jgi:cobalamin biosynthetic protein CobC